MTDLSAALAAVRTRSAELLDPALIRQLCREANYHWRERSLPPEESVYLLLHQLLAQVSLQGLRRVAHLGISAQAIHSARQCLPVTVLITLAEWVASEARNAKGAIWKGHRVVLADGTSCIMPDTPEVVARYGRRSNGRGRSYAYPVPLVMALMDLGTGMIMRLIPLPAHRGESSALRCMFDVLQAGDLLLADRGLPSFAVLATAALHQVEYLIGITSRQVVDRKDRHHAYRLRRLGSGDWIVRWLARAPSKAMTRHQWDMLPKELDLRQVSFRLYRKGYRTRSGNVITSLLDPVQYPAQEIVDLYLKRWQVEVYFRDLKQTLGMAQLSSRTCEGVRKELLGYVLLYNLVRGIMCEAAKRQHVDPDRISFADALTWLLYASPGEDLPRLVVNTKRVRPTEPRCVKKNRRPYPPLSGLRDPQRLPVCQARSLS